MTANCWLSEDGTKLVTLSPDRKHWVGWKLRQPSGVGSHWVMETSRPVAQTPDPAAVFERFVVEGPAPDRPRHGGYDDSWIVKDTASPGVPWVAKYSNEWVDAEDWARQLAADLNKKENRE